MTIDVQKTTETRMIKFVRSPASFTLTASNGW